MSTPLGVVGFLVCAIVLVPYLVVVLWLEPEIFPRLYLVPPLVLFAGLTLYYYEAARPWLESGRDRRRKGGLLAVSILAGAVVVVGAVFVTYLCRLGRWLLLRKGFSIPAPMRTVGFQAGVTGAAVLVLFPVMNAMYFSNGMFREIVPQRKTVVMANPLFGTNAQGFRGPPVSPEPSAGASTPRLLFVGDSSTFGWPYPYDQAFPFLVGRRLAERGLAVETINAGVPGFGIVEIRQRLDGYLAYRPDLVFAMIGFHEGQAEHLRGRGDAPARAENHAFRPKFLPPMLLETLLLGVWTNYEAADRVIRFFAPSPARASEDPPEGDPERDALFAAELEAFLQRLRAAGTRLVFVDYPSPAIEPAIRAAILGAAARHELDVVALGEDAPPVRFARDDNVHPDRDGHERIADAIVAWVLDSGAIPGRR